MTADCRHGVTTDSVGMTDPTHAVRTAWWACCRVVLTLSGQTTPQ